jgi:predicted amidohydrolase YtcJ
VLIANVQINGHDGVIDVRCSDGENGGVITQLGKALSRAGEDCIIDGQEGALLAGLHDHHLHLLAYAALCNSVQCGPPLVFSRAELRDELRSACTGGALSDWLRGVNYHESVAGELNSATLDELVSNRPLKIQHRSGKMWMVNSLAAKLLSLQEYVGMPGVELDLAGKPSGRLFRLDAWMRDQVASDDHIVMPSLFMVSQQLASYGVTGVTDASPDNSLFAMRHFEACAESGELLQKVRVLGDDDLPESVHKKVERGERKILLDENNLPNWDDFYTIVNRAHDTGRGVAVHCVTPVELVLTLSVLQAAGVHPQDRIEHASLVPEDVMPLLSQTGVRVVTQPGFIYGRGDQYLQDVPAQQWCDLYRGGQLLANDIALAGSSDAPYGDADPWAAMRAAVDRKTRGTQVIGAAEALTPEQALALFSSAADDPGGVSRAISVGAIADFCLLDRSWAEARLRLRSEDVRCTFIGGELIYQRKKCSAVEERYVSAA